MNFRPTNLLERETEIDALRRALGEAVEGGSRVVGLRGEPGVGKTRLLSEVAGVTRGGRASEHEREVPFALLEELFTADPQVRSARSALSDRDARALATVSSDLGADCGPPPGCTRVAATSSPGDLYGVARAIRALLEVLGRDQPVVTMLDDVHWADPASTEVLAQLLHRPPRGGVLIVLATRAGQAPVVETALAHAVRHGAGVLLDLQPLSVRAVGLLHPQLSRAGICRLRPVICCGARRSSWLRSIAISRCAILRASAFTCEDV